MIKSVWIGTAAALAVSMGLVAAVLAARAATGAYEAGDESPAPQMKITLVTPRTPPPAPDGPKLETVPPGAPDAPPPRAGPPPPLARAAPPRPEPEPREEDFVDERPQAWRSKPEPYARPDRFELREWDRPPDPRFEGYSRGEGDEGDDDFEGDPPRRRWRGR